MDDHSPAAARLDPPTAFPAPGTFGVTQRVTLLSEEPDVTIHYTLDGSEPTTDSPIFAPYVLPVLEALNEGNRGVTSTYTIRAFAVKEGWLPSEVASFTYVIDRRDTDVYIRRELGPSIIQILDYDDTKMMLIIGTKRALLLDAGLGNGDLRAYVEPLIGELPLDVVISHGHPDHIAAMGQFQDHYDVYMNHRDLPMVEMFAQQMNFRIDLEQITHLGEGAEFDLGDRRLRVYEVPGHSRGSIVLFDEENGLLFASDAVGSNRPTIVDSLWMQFPGMAPIDEYLSTLQRFRAKLAVPIKESYGGHNDLPIYGEAYLDNLQAAAQRLVDEGEAALVPSLRPTDAWQVVVGDRLSNPNWVAINVAKETCLSAPADQIATLSNLHFDSARLEPAFSQKHYSYTLHLDAEKDQIRLTPTTTSTQASLEINGSAAGSGESHAFALPADGRIELSVTAADGVTRNSYRLTITQS